MISLLIALSFAVMPKYVNHTVIEIDHKMYGTCKAVIQSTSPSSRCDGEFMYAAYIKKCSTGYATGDTVLICEKEVKALQEVE